MNFNFDSLLSNFGDLLSGGIFSGSTSSTDLFRSLTGSGLTSAEIAQNVFNAEQAESAWYRNELSADRAMMRQQELRQTAIGDTVKSAQSAGINPYFVLGSGAAGPSSAPQASAPAASGSGGARNGAAALSAIMDLAFASQRFKESNASIRNIDANTEKVKNESKLIGLQSSWYPTLQENTIKEINSRIRGNDAAANLDDAKAAHEYVLKSISETDSEWRGILNYLESQYKSASSSAARASAARDFASAALDKFELSYMKDHNTHVPSGSSELVALASWITENLGTNESEVVNTIADAIKNGGFESQGKGNSVSKYSWLKDIPDDKLSDSLRKKKHDLFGD